MAATGVKMNRSDVAVVLGLCVYLPINPMLTALRRVEIEGWELEDIPTN
jgi:hypothetical protein